MKKANIKINYMILEHLLKYTNVYHYIKDPDESHPFSYLPAVFDMAKTGDIESMFTDENDKLDYNKLNMFLDEIIGLTGMPEKYWLGNERINFGLRFKNNAYKTMPLNIRQATDSDFSEESISLNCAVGKVQYGDVQQKIIDNPLGIPDEFFDTFLDYNKNNYKEFKKFYNEIKNEFNDEIIQEDAINSVEKMYSLPVLILYFIRKIAIESDIYIIDRTKLYIDREHMAFTKKSSVNKEDNNNKYSHSLGIYSIEFRLGNFSTLIETLFHNEILVLYRDLNRKKH